jgi:putrescine transport system ATP-binding protein
MAEQGGEPFLRIERVSKSFGPFKAVIDVSLTVGKGEIFSLLGGSGCGKTTLLRMLAGFEEPTSGRIFLDGRDMAGVPPWRTGSNTPRGVDRGWPSMTRVQRLRYGS